MAVTTNTRKLAALLGASGAGIGTDGLLQAAAVDANVATQAELDVVSTTVTANATTAKADTTNVRQDITTLALKQAVQEDSTKFNLPNSSVVQFQADADFNLGGSTTITRNASDYISTNPSTTSSASNFAPPIKQISTTTTAPSTSSYAGVNATNDLMGVVVGGGGQGAMGIDFGWDLATDWHFRGWYTNSDNSGSADGEDYPSGSVLITTDTSKATGTTPSSLWDTASTNTYYSLTPAQWADVLNTSYASTIGASSLTDYYTHNTTSSPPHTHNLSSTSGQGVVRHYANDGAAYGGLDVNYDASASQMVMKMFIDDSFTTLSTDSQHIVTVTNISNTGRAYISMGEAMDDDRNWSTTHLNGALTDYSTATLTSSSVEAAGTALGTANVPSSAVTKVSGVILYKDAYGTATFGEGAGDDLEIYFTCNGGTNWTTVASYTAVTPVFSTGIKMVKLGETTCTSGSDVRYKAEWRNQVISSKETQLHGIGLNY